MNRGDIPIVTTLTLTIPSRGERESLSFRMRTNYKILKVDWELYKVNYVF